MLLKKIPLFLFILFLPLNSYADSFYRIEGMTLGESLLKYYSKSEILKMTSSIEKDNEAYRVKDDNPKMRETNQSLDQSYYDYISIMYSSDDPEFLIHSVVADKYFDTKESFEECKNEMNKLALKVIKQTKNADFLGPADITENIGNDRRAITQIVFRSDNSNPERIQINCIDLIDNTIWGDYLNISIKTYRAETYIRERWGM